MLFFPFSIFHFHVLFLYFLVFYNFPYFLYLFVFILIVFHIDLDSFPLISISFTIYSLSLAHIFIIFMYFKFFMMDFCVSEGFVTRVFCLLVLVCFLGFTFFHFVYGRVYFLSHFLFCVCIVLDFSFVAYFPCYSAYFICKSSVLFIIFLLDSLCIFSVFMSFSVFFFLCL